MYATWCVYYTDTCFHAHARAQHINATIWILLEFDVRCRHWKRESSCSHGLCSKAREKSTDFDIRMKFTFYNYNYLILHFWTNNEWIKKHIESEVDSCKFVSLLVWKQVIFYLLFAYNLTRLYTCTLTSQVHHTTQSSVVLHWKCTDAIHFTLDCGGKYSACITSSLVWILGWNLF